MEPEHEQREAEALVRTLSAIQDMRQRSYALAGRLSQLGNEAALDMLKTIRAKALLGNTDFLRLYNGLLCSGVLMEVMGPGRIAELVETAKDAQELDILAILADIRSEAMRGIPEQPFLDRELKEKPLGARKALARRFDPKLIKRIARDQDPRVIRNLLSNPRLTESDVICIASTRPISPRVLMEIYDHPRWVTRYAVKKAMTLNPYTPVSVVLRLLPFMSVRDLEEIRSSRDLNSRVIQEAGRILQDKLTCLNEGKTS